jgi:hypothetical protein
MAPDRNRGSVPVAKAREMNKLTTQSRSEDRAFSVAIHPMLVRQTPPAEPGRKAKQVSENLNQPLRLKLRSCVGGKGDLYETLTKKGDIKTTKT